jgi:hypothetical protein
MITTRFVRDAHEDTRQRAYRARRPEANEVLLARAIRGLNCGMEPTVYVWTPPASMSRLRRRARSFSDVGDACFHGQRLRDAIAGEEKARSDHCSDEGAAPPDGVG